jgi:hypothetical protein
MLPYKVTKKYLKGPEQEAAKFDNESNAKEFIKTKLLEDRTMRVETVYSLYDMGELIETFNQSYLKDDDSSGSGSSDQGSRQRGSGNAFNPLKTSPRPTGMPDSAFKRNDDNNDNKDDNK